MDSHFQDATASAFPTASLSNLRARAELISVIRSFFAAHAYLEVETPLLSRDVCVDAWLEPCEVNLSGWGRYFLQTSPEFHMKRLIACGAERIFQLTRSFRAGERGPRHNPEFTILEWYAVGETYEQQMEFVEQLVRAVAMTPLSGEQRRIDEDPLPMPTAPFPRIRYDDAFARWSGTRVLSLSSSELRSLADKHDLAVPRSLRPDDRDGLLNLLLSGIIEPALAESGAVFLQDYPESQAALARVRDDSPPIAERFEMYLNGIEICNGYQELTDADELDRRMVSQSTVRDAEGLSKMPVLSRLSDAMRDPGLPDCAGVALGVDRLVMWRLGATHLDDVVAFPIHRA